MADAKQNARAMFICAKSHVRMSKRTRIRARTRARHLAEARRFLAKAIAWRDMAKEQCRG